MSDEATPKNGAQTATITLSEAEEAVVAKTAIDGAKSPPEPHTPANGSDASEPTEVPLAAADLPTAPGAQRPGDSTVVEQVVEEAAGEHTEVVADNGRAGEQTALDLGEQVDPRDIVPEGYLKAGTEELWIAAKGDFEEKALRGYAPSPESKELHVDLNNFDGPLDLLLHLIRQHALDILDIPIAKITQSYLSILDDMRTLNLDVAGEFLVMAAQLAHIKSKMLLPREETDEEEQEQEDPRLALVRRLLEYQRFQDAAGWLSARDWLGRDIFQRPEGARAFNPDAMPTPDDPTYGLVQLEPIRLIKTLDVILKRSSKKIVHEVVLERLNVGQRINELVDLAKELESFTLFDAVEAFGGLQAGKGNIIVTFLAILEMTKFKLLRIHQAQEDGTIYISPVQENLAESDIAIEGYADEAPQGLPV
jgi:segregation and condensation protein A